MNIVLYLCAVLCIVLGMIMKQSTIFATIAICFVILGFTSGKGDPDRKNKNKGGK